MNVDFSLDTRKAWWLLLATGCLAFLFWTGGWFSSVVVPPEIVFPRLAAYSARLTALVPRPLEDVRPAALAVPTREEMLARGVRDLGDLLQEISFTSSVPVGEAGVGSPVYLTLLDDRLWKERLDDGLLRVTPYARLADAFGRDHWFTVVAGVFTQSEPARRLLDLLRDKGERHSYLVSATHREGRTFHVVMAGDYKGLGNAEAVRDRLGTSDGQPSLVAFSEPLSSGPLKDSLAAPAELPEPEPPPEPTPSEPETPEPAPEPAPVEETPVTPSPFTLRLDCYNSRDDARRAVDWYAEHRNVTAFFMKPEGSGRCGWVVYAGDFPDKDAALDFRKSHELEKSLVRRKPYTLRVDASDEETARRLTELGYGPYHRDGAPEILFAGVFNDEATATAWADAASQKGISVTVVERGGGAVEDSP